MLARKQEAVSVPFRGSRSEILIPKDVTEAAKAFPSPFGFHVLKSSFKHAVKAYMILSFPSPFGVHVLKWTRPLSKAQSQSVSVPFRGSRSEMERIKMAKTRFSPKFPSPFGVHVLKLDA